MLLWHLLILLLSCLNFQPRNSHTSPLFKQNSILKFQDKISLENILFVRKPLNSLSPSVFNTWLSFSSDQHNYETSSSTQDNLIKLFYKTNRWSIKGIVKWAVPCKCVTLLVSRILWHERIINNKNDSLNKLIIAKKSR